MDKTRKQDARGDHSKRPSIEAAGGTENAGTAPSKVPEDAVFFCYILRILRDWVQEQWEKFLCDGNADGDL
jgi:hypothetical protein